MDIWSFNQQLTRKLKSWAIFSILTGILFQLLSRFSRGIGIQFIGWGAVNFLIATFGSKSTQKRREKLPDPNDLKIQRREATNLRRLLLVNSFLDVLYIGGGLWLAKSRDGEDRFRKGNGIGIMLQGAFLLLFDLFQTIYLKNSIPDKD